jgi:hypothetical protein
MSQVGLDFVISQMGQSGTDTKWGGATMDNFRHPIQVAPQRSVVEAHYAWREGAPKTTAPTKAVFNYFAGSTAMSTRKPVPAPLPYQRENGPSATVAGRAGSRPHHQSMSSPSAHLSSTKDYTSNHLQPVGFRLPGASGSASAPNIAGSRYAGARVTPTSTVYNNAGTAT